MNKIKLIIFDAGDILYDATLWRKYLYQYLVKHFKIKLTYAEVFYFWDNYYLKEIYQGRADYKESFMRFMELLGIDLTEKQKKQLEARKKEIEKNTKPREWVLPLFKKLKRNKTMIAILTDSESRGTKVARRYKEWSIFEYIDAIVSSKDIGFIKPYRESYEFVLTKLKCRPENALFVGHDYDEILGAKNVGIKAIEYTKSNEFIVEINNVFKN